MSDQKKPAMKPLLIGESNPYGGDGYFVLYPSPEGCSGHRLCVKILGLTRAAHLDNYDRVNLCDGPWDRGVAVARAHGLVTVGERVLVALGAKVRDALEYHLPVPTPRMFTWNQYPSALRVVWLPHPSGRCLLWNEPGAIERARDLLREAGALPATPSGSGPGDDAHDW